MIYEHFVIDDLREFVNDTEAFYIKNTSAFKEWMDSCGDEVEITNLYLDHDLGWDKGENEFTSIRRITPLLLQMIGDLRLDIENIYIITSNPVGRKWLISECQDLCNYVYSADASELGLLVQYD